MNTSLTAKSLGLLAVATLALSACSSSASDAEGTPAAAESMSGGAVDATPPAGSADDESMGGDATLAEVPEQLAFTSTLLADGADFDGASLAGSDTILWFWAPWCPNCQAEAPEIAAASMNLPEGVTLIGVPGRSDSAAMEEFTAQYGLEGFDHLVDEDGSLWSTFKVASQPAFAFINDDGTVETLPGSLSEQGVIDAANELAAR